ncbi:MAG TPA: pyridoxal phosphate-dependent aminotransferase family protein [Spirochaetota bacterium]|nr:pyridoxal phosphate-dependent aminotransferase family protein [Spirochaetota bacterium]HOM37661.1 pyridoxal phosphate-dependent aminotransferase family protein [Spirochaetota bacterium]HPQ49619.1 pyridoxal phosphate-dependent aminotransferase family protein [Spirochaetota bacterium]
MYEFFLEKLNSLKIDSIYRTIKKPMLHEGHFLIEKETGKKILNLSSNDYLGIGFDKSILNEFLKKIKDENIEYYFFSSSGSRLLSGNSLSYEELEATLKEFYKKDVIVLNSGYHANIGLISSLFDYETIIFFDKLCHASIIDGIKLSGAKFYRYNHLDYNHLEKLLKNHRNNYKNSVIITESVFSMDGDIADIETLLYLKEKYNCLLYIDEAHSVGCMGQNGLGVSFKENLFDRIDIFLGTFGKAYASIGSFIVADKIIIDYIINKTRTFIYTTALPPIVLSWNNFILKKSFHKFHNRRESLNYIAKYTREKLSSLGLKVLGESHIIPLVIGTNEDTIILSEYLYKNGFYALPIRYPTVPKMSARIRFSLNSLVEKNNIDTLYDQIKEYYERNMAK